ncbi:MAG TPA: adenylate/guanylate cyclase domain-containing protein [Sphingobium sp.]|nr:adenylate/guanylate cyclase domain-containing protein [Sphingobium sp.]
MARWTKEGIWPVVPGLVAVILVALLQLAHVPALDRIGLLLFDSYQRAQPRPYEDAPVRVVDIDDETIRRLGQWPWPRTDIARLTERLADAGAAAIAFDIVFAEPDRTSPARIAERLRRDGGSDPAITALTGLPDHDAVLAAAFAKAPVVTGYFLLHGAKGPAVQLKAGVALAGSPPRDAITQYDRAIEPIAALGAAATGSGFVSMKGDSDGIVRRAPLLAMQHGELLPSLALDALRVAQGAGSIMVKTSDGSGETRGAPGDVVSVKAGAFAVPTSPDGALWMHYTAPRPGRVVPAWKILSGAIPPAEMARLFGGRIVFVGAGAIGLRDLVSTPLEERTSGVLVHAQAVEQMVLGRFLVRPDWAEGLERSLLLVLGIGMALLLPRLGAARGAVLGVVLIAGMAWGSWHAFAKWQFLLDPTYPVIGLAAGYVVESALAYYREERRRAYIHNAFDRYLSPELVKRIADDPARLELGGEEREMTVLFCDIRSFSRMSESMAPKDVIRFLISFLTPMCDILLARKATIDKFIGDAILAFWNAPLDDPDQHENAARGALEMVARLEGLNREMGARKGEPWPGEVRIGVGLNTGLCCVGNMGSAQRLSYSLIGDTVNLASRIEGLTKYYGVPIAIGSALGSRLPGFALLELDRVRVVGRDRPETLFALLGDERLAADPAFRAVAAGQAEMLARFRGRDWDGARHALAATEGDGARFGLSTLHALYRERIDACAANPPGADWDGVFRATEK